LRRALRGARAAWWRARFRLWAARLDLELRRRGGRLVLDAPHGLRFDGPPRIRAVMRGEGDGTFTLRVGRRASVGRDLHLEVWAQGTNVLELGDDAYLLDGVRILLRSGSVRLGARTLVRDYSVLKSEGVLEIGADAQVSYHSVIHCRERVELADRVMMAERVTVVDSEKVRDGGDTPIVEGPLRVGPIALGRNVYVGAGVVITHGSRVGENSTVAAGAVLAGGEFPAGWVIGGVPATALRPLGEPSLATPPG